MSIKDLKFDTSDFSGKDISSLPDRPGDSGITGQQLKERFDLIPKMVVALGGFNGLIDELGKTASGSSGASNIGVSSISGVSGSNVQTVLGSLGTMAKNAKTAADTAAAQGTAAESAALRATEAAENAAEKATAAENATGAAVAAANEASQAAAAATAAITEVKDYAAEQAQSAKDYVDNVILEGGAVTSVFGRAGEVKAQAGDYTADMVGALPNANGAVTAAKLASGAVTETKIANGAVTAAKLASGAVTPESIGAVSKSGDSMTGALLVDTSAVNAVKAARTTAGKKHIAAFGVGNYLSEAGIGVQAVAEDDQNTNLAQMYITQTKGIVYKGKNDSSYRTLYDTGNKPTAADVGAPTLESNGRINGSQACSAIGYVNTASIIRVTVGNNDIGRTMVIYGTRAATVTIPTGLPVGSELEIVRWGTGTVTITGATGVTLNGVEGSKTINSQYGVVSLKRLFADSDDWLIVGDLG